MTPPLRIAVADDEPDMRDYFRKILPRLGHEVVAVAANGRELVEQCRATAPDLVITDIKMPELDGIEAARQINHERPVPIILMSAYHDPERTERAGAGAVTDHLVKPIRQADLIPALDRALDRFEQSRESQEEAGRQAERGP